MTVKSVCYEAMEKLCKSQDFGAAAAVRDVQRLVDPKGTKELKPNQVKAVKGFLKLVAATAYS
ncbi:MAG: hypothetical protein KGJ35_00380 [Patescibacteria group bacterium]|nr:hypothetical protein [Patescibacteria group bacterium]